MSTPDPGDHAECDGCHYRDPVGGLAEARGYPTQDPSRLCALCRGTFAGIAALFPGLYSDQAAMLRTIAWVGNRLREDIARGPADLDRPPPGA